MNIILFCGAFDPVHNGHINMAKVASETLDAEVIFVPAKNAIWKDSEITIEDKYQMLSLAIKGYPKFKISRYEIDNPDDRVYSINTIKHFRNAYPNDKLFFLIGSDQVNKFHLWKNPEEIAELTQIVYYSRSNEEVSSDNIKKYHMQKVVGEMVNISSTEIRSFHKLDLPIEVLDYIIEHDLYVIPKIKSYMNPKRFAHSVSVAHLAFDIAISNNLANPYKYFLACLLHDIGKEMKIVKQKEIVEKLFPEYVNLESVIYHQFVGEYLIQRDFGIDDKEILEAVRYHTTGKDDMPPLMAILYCADKIEPLRGFDSNELIKDMKVNYLEGCKTVFKANKLYFEQRNINYNNPLTLKAMEYYTKD